VCLHRHTNWNTIEWGGEIPQPDGSSIIVQGLSYNSSLPWSKELMEKFIDKWYWTDLSRNPWIPWTLDLLEYFNDYWDWDILQYFPDMWDKVFNPLLNDDTIDMILNKISEKL
jgi:hypothetical protein